jgi:NAD(P)-dependent dehydrogenase (short-subunit alcohol dehydrogenase family)
MARIVIVTGGASGIGAGLCRSHAADGDTVVAADVDTAGLDLVVDDAARRGNGRVSAAEMDVRDDAAVRALVDLTVERHGRIDVIYNNAGIGVGGNSHELDTAHWDRVIDINLRGVVHGVQAALPHMLRQRSGHIVNTASLAGLIPSPGLAPYAATKHAVVGMTLSLRAEYASRGVRFTVVCPGFTDTPILDKPMPADLPQPAGQQPVREMADSLPGGIYELDALIADIRAGVKGDDAMIVAPRSARAAWRSFRLAPAKFVDLLAGRAEAQLRRLGS